ncbi:MAG: preprotein translocase subunit SecE [bacterium]|nr:preprotein translocase subunit SecE [bacterium]
MVNFKTYISEVNEEMRKVNWPTWANLKSSTGVVVFVSLLLAATVYFFDFLLSRAVGWIL